MLPLEDMTLLKHTIANNALSQNPITAGYDFASSSFKVPIIEPEITSRITQGGPIVCAGAVTARHQETFQFSIPARLLLF